METLKSRAVVFPRPLVVEVAEVDLPEPGDGDVVVEVAFSALSPGTERWCLRGLLEATDGSPVAFPHVPGYQAAGVVRAVGSAVAGLRPGDRVFSRNCRAPRGWPATWWGGHVGLHVADPRDVLRLPDGVSLRAGASLLLAQVGYNGASRPHIEPGAVAAVIGDGLVGQYAAQVLRGRGARVLLAGLVGERLALARRHSADEVFDAGQGDFGAFVRSRAPEGAAVAVEAAGTAATVAQAVGLLRRGRPGGLAPAAGPGADAALSQLAHPAAARGQPGPAGPGGPEGRGARHARAAGRRCGPGVSPPARCGPPLARRAAAVVDVRGCPASCNTRRDGSRGMPCQK
jgi:3-hydroxyethyl bacteriochlorophyllide a dehydrogenase